MRGQNARYPINGQIVRVRVGICLVAHRGIFLAVCTRDFPRIHHAQMHTHTAGLADVFCTELRTGRFGGSSEIQSLAPRPLEQSFVPFLPFFFLSFFLSLHLAKRLCKTRSRAVDITKAAAVEYIIYIYKVIPAFRLSVRGEKIRVHCLCIAVLDRIAISVCG